MCVFFTSATKKLETQADVPGPSDRMYLNEPCLQERGKVGSDRGITILVAWKLQVEWGEVVTSVSMLILKVAKIKLSIRVNS